MPKENLTEIVCVFDRSGSMGSIREDAQEALNAFVDDQKKVEGEANITLVQFNTEFETVWENTPIQDAPKYELIPSGCTALLDAVGRTINKVGERLKNLSDEKRPGKVIFVIVTDGQENSSQEFKRDQINQMVKHQTEKYQWVFSFLAANQDAIQEAQNLGVNAANAMNFAATGQGVNAAMHRYSRGVSSYRVSGDLKDAELPEHAPDEDSQKLKSETSSSSS